ncbi:MAG: type II toxin-antitoxin system PemK/MazF family toxin [Bacilli bacterium]|nr:type II toxin-antitoxin system PemK/MazF family toxin [Bacilli bacterium]
MCKFGDIIVVNKYVAENGQEIGEHSFIVIDDEGSTISGLEYSFVASVISSFKNNKKKKLSYEGNIELPDDAVKGIKLKKESYVKADQAFYFNKKKISYYILGSVNDEYYDQLIKLVLNLALKGKLKRYIENL